MKRVRGLEDGGGGGKNALEQDPTQGNIPSRHISPSSCCHTTLGVRCVGPKVEGEGGGVYKDPKCEKSQS